jgi:hypothetical protein
VSFSGRPEGASPLEHLVRVYRVRPGHQRHTRARVQRQLYDPPLLCNRSPPANTTFRSRSLSATHNANVRLKPQRCARGKLRTPTNPRLQQISSAFLCESLAPHWSRIAKRGVTARSASSARAGAPGLHSSLLRETDNRGDEAGAGCDRIQHFSASHLSPSPPPGQPFRPRELRAACRGEDWASNSIAGDWFSGNPGPASLGQVTHNDITRIPQK